MNFKEYANSFQSVSRLGLGSTESLMEILCNPQDQLKFIHIAGTNGKGSVCSFIQNGLTLSGKKTGKFTSPDMLCVRERISIDGENISESDMNKYLNRIQEAASVLKNEKDITPTQFEIWTAAAFCYFYDRKCDYVVLETGLGGRLDATNIIKTPVICVITKIAMDHMNYLGNTIEKIAFEKCGIIKEGVPVVTCNQEKDATDVINAVCKEKNCRVITTNKPTLKGIKDFSEIFDYGSINNINLSLKGYHQIENGCIAAEVLKTLKVPDHIIKKALESSSNMGRFEIISQSPLTIFDGAHNINGFSALLFNLKRYSNPDEFTFICAFMRDKNISSIIKLIKEFGRKITVYAVTVKNNPRAENEKVLSEKFRNSGIDSIPFSDISCALSEANKNGKPIVICGSLYLYKDLKEMC